MSINNYIDQYYDVKYQTVDNIKDAEMVLLGDIHSSNACQKINSIFINLFSKKSDVLLVEGFKSLELVNIDECGLAIGIESEVDVYGWDTDVPGNVSVKVSNMPDEAKRCMIEFYKITAQLFALDLIKNEDKAIELKKKSIELCMKTSALLPSLLGNQLSPEFPEIVASTFAERVTSMITSLDHFQSKTHRIFLIAVFDHLQTSVIIDNNYSLDEFYNYIKQKKVVILFPKKDVIDLINSQFDCINNKAYNLYLDERYASNFD